VALDDAEAFSDTLLHTVDNKSEFEVKGPRSRKLAEQQFNRIGLADKWQSWMLGAIRS
jgi:hypothetical protein